MSEELMSKKHLESEPQDRSHQTFDSTTIKNTVKPELRGSISLDPVPLDLNTSLLDEPVLSGYAEMSKFENALKIKVLEPKEHTLCPSDEAYAEWAANLKVDTSMKHHYPDISDDTIKSSSESSESDRIRGAGKSGTDRIYSIGKRGSEFADPVAENTMSNDKDMGD